MNEYAEHKSGVEVFPAFALEFLEIDYRGNLERVFIFGRTVQCTSPPRCDDVMLNITVLEVNNIFIGQRKQPRIFYMKNIG